MQFGNKSSIVRDNISFPLYINSDEKFGEAYNILPFNKYPSINKIELVLTKNIL